MTAEYVVRSGHDYIMTVDREASTWVPKLWTKCQHCAQRMNRTTAHELHRGKPGLEVRRIVRREGS
ncbi:MAG: hypothetical protein HRJ53_12780 [Acidobacteria bacterium Pan2503]|uniref:Uncharacterized protein n=1 Tax=Candidatus Acidiferrum panamense TaxID=2741543 RepID=A0A7V8NR03_9BACT|nr:hypothetical protein [Candidatus Acidoferrum panamensis]